MIGQIAAGSRSIHAICFSGGGNRLACSGDAGEVYVYSFPELQPLLPGPSGHSERVTSLAFTPDGALLVSAGSDGKVKVWDAVTGAQLRDFSDHEDTPNSVVSTADSLWCASASDDRTIRLWPLKGQPQASRMLGDLDSNEESVSGSQYQQGGEVLTLPCGSPIPPGAVCTCNCVPGSICSCVGHETCSCVGDESCACVGDACPCVDYSCSCVGHTCDCVGDMCACVSDTCGCVGDHCSCDSYGWCSCNLIHYWYPN